MRCDTHLEHRDIAHGDPDPMHGHRELLGSSPAFLGKRRLHGQEGRGGQGATGCMGKHTVRPKLHKFTGQFPLPKSSYRLNPQHTTPPSRRLQEERRSFQSSSGQLRVGDCGFVMARLYLAFRQHTERPRSSGRGNWVCL